MTNPDSERNPMANYKCNICGGNLILTIGSDTAFCDHCGQAEPVDPQDVIKYQDVYCSAETLMRTDTLSGYTDALTRLQSISFIPEAKEKAVLCEKRIKELQQLQPDMDRRKNHNDKNDTKLGVIIAVFLVLLLAALAVGIAYVIYRLIKGDLTHTDVIIIGSVAAAFVVLLIVGKIRS